MTELEVWIEGSSLPGYAPEQAAADFARLAKISPEQARALLSSGKYRRVKRCDAATAEALVKRLTDIGVAAECRVPENAETPKPERQPAAEQGRAQTRDWMAETVVVPPGAKAKVADLSKVDKGLWRDTPKVVPFLHGFRWHWDAFRVTQINIKGQNAVIFLPSCVYVYGVLIGFALFCSLGYVPHGTLLFPAVMGMFSSFWGFYYARSIQTNRRGEKDGAEDRFAACKPGPQLPSLLLLSLCFALLWYFLPFLLGLLRLLYPASPIMLLLVCLVGGGFILLVVGHFLAASLALTHNTGLAGLGRICWAGIKNSLAFLACCLVISLFAAGVEFLLQLNDLAFQGDHGRRAGLGKMKLAMLVTGLALVHLMNVAYAAARDIFYEKSPDDDA